ncbi:hypothetical protein BH10PAT1_BH10PAT1_7200 [soil metagenome]
MENRQIVSFGDAHSLPKLGREATIFDLDEITYTNIFNAIKNPGKIISTIEFYPEEGKYHFSGHLKCGVVRSPNEIKKLGKICPVCSRELTIGVSNRVYDIGKLNIETNSITDKFGVRWIENKNIKRPNYVMLVPLQEIITETVSVGFGSKKVVNLYDEMITKLGSEFKILLETDLDDIETLFGAKIANAISKVRLGDIVIEPGFDGQFGKVAIDHTSLF